jgi:small subunit ribosomal protein S6
VAGHRYTRQHFLPRQAPTVPERRADGEAVSDRGKEEFGNVNPYEVLLMLDPELAEERQSEIIARAQEIVTKGSGVWHASEPWGRRKLAYEIDKKGEAHYHLLSFDSDPATLDELTRVLRITEGAMRHMAVRRPKGSTKPRAQAVEAAE